MNLTYCLAEDREGAEIGLKLAILSLADHCPGVPVVLYRPNPIPSFVDWLKQQPQVRLVAEPLDGASSWNCKPQAMLPLLGDDPEAEVVWVDSDLMVSRDPRELFRRLSIETLGITQEPPSHPDPGVRLRAEGWGFPPGNNYSFTMNSCVVRITQHHRKLMERWLECLQHPEYLAFAQRPLSERPVHYRSDQDVLNALLGSAEFQHIPIGLFPNGQDVIHSGGALAYSLSERIRGLFLKQPTFIHAISIKPWMVLGNQDPWSSPRRWWWRSLQQEISPYVALARGYRNRVDEPTGWMDATSGWGRCLRMIGFGHWALCGLPVTLVATWIDKLGMTHKIRKD
jgi:hypothetical protein